MTEFTFLDQFTAASFDATWTTQVLNLPYALTGPPYQTTINASSSSNFIRTDALGFVEEGEYTIKLGNLGTSPPVATNGYFIQIGNPSTTETLTIRPNASSPSGWRVFSTMAVSGWFKDYDPAFPWWRLKHLSFDSIKLVNVENSVNGIDWIGESGVSVTSDHNLRGAFINIGVGTGYSSSVIVEVDEFRFVYRDTYQSWFSKSSTWNTLKIVDKSTTTLWNVERKLYYAPTLTGHKDSQGTRFF